jgi:type IV pilus assembly protein PilC/MSHA biogenesis protein MshG
MPTFEYEALGGEGQILRGTILGATLDQALGELNARGMKVQKIQAAALLNDPLSGGYAVRPPEAPKSDQQQAIRETSGFNPDDPLLKQRNYVATSVVGPLVGKVALSRLLFFFRQLAAMLGAGVPYAQSLNTLKGQARDPRLGRIIGEMVENVEAGRPISVAMQRYPEVFSTIMVSMIRVGEETGGLDRSLQQTADYIEREIELRNLYRRVTIYPKIVLVASIFIVLGTNAIIASLGKQGGLASPLTNPATWIILGPLIVGTFLFLRVGLANPRVRRVWDEFILYVPYLGKTLHQVAMAKFGRAFGALYKAGVSMPRAIKLSADACGNEALRARMYPISSQLEEGSRLTPVFEDSRAFSPIVLDMISTGEQTGSLDQMLNKMADYYEDEGKTRAQQLGQVFGVAVLLGVAVYVGFIVISFYMGYFGGITKELG